MVSLPCAWMFVFSAPPAVRPLYDDGGLPHGLVFERPRRVVRFDDRAVLVERE